MISGYEGNIILKGTDKEIVAKDSKGGLIVLPYADIESIISEENNFRFNYNSEKFYMEGSNVKTEINAKEKTKRTEVEIKYMNHILSMDSKYEKISKVNCFRFGLITPTDKMSSKCIIYKTADNQPEFMPIYNFGARITRMIIEKQTVKEELQIHLAKNALQNSYFQINNRTALKHIGRLLM